MSISYIFLFSPNFSGTTIISQYLRSHIKNSYLPEYGNYEGQMVPTVKPMMRNKPWEEESFFDWDFIKKEWDKLAENEGKKIFIEASPPNIMRVGEILENFNNHKYIFSIASPYTYIGSHLYKRRKIKDKTIKIITKQWLMKAEKQINNINVFGDSGIQISYEKFCESPKMLLESLGINTNRKNFKERPIKGKANTEINTIVNMLPKHLAFLGIRNIIQVNQILKNHIDTLNFFGYKILTIDDCNELINHNSLLAYEGLQRKVNRSIKLPKNKKIIKEVPSRFKSLRKIFNFKL